MDRKLETFLAVCRTMNYRAAAEQLHLTQPAVTKQIQALEAMYGAKLFRYDGRKLSKTEKGRILEVHAIGLQYNDVELERAMRGEEKTQLRIGATKSIGDYILVPEIKRFLDGSDNALYFTVDNTAHLLAQLERGELDFVVLEGIFDKRRYDSFLLRNEPFIGICAAGHPFCARQVPLEEVLAQRLILREPGSGTRNILERELAQQGQSVASFRKTVCVSSFKIIRELVGSGYGVSFLYEAVVGDDANFGHFYCEGLTGAHELNVVYLKGTKAGEYAHAFVRGAEQREVAKREGN